MVFATALLQKRRMMRILLVALCIVFARWFMSVVGAANRFVTVWDTNLPGGNLGQLILPTYDGGYNFDIFWQSLDHPSMSGLITNISPTWPYTLDLVDSTAPGQYLIEITWTFPRLQMQDAVDALRLIEIRQRWEIERDSMVGAFASAASLQITAIDAPILSNVHDMSSMFADTHTIDGNFGTRDITSISSMSGMFLGSALSTSTYDELLLGWAQQEILSGVVFHAGDSQYCVGAEARWKLIHEHDWVIFDNGQASACMHVDPNDDSDSDNDDGNGDDEDNNGHDDGDGNGDEEDGNGDNEDGDGEWNDDDEEDATSSTPTTPLNYGGWRPAWEVLAEQAAQQHMQSWGVSGSIASSTGNVFDKIHIALERHRLSCNYDQAVTWRISPQLRDLTWEMRFDPPSVLTTFCITEWYQDRWHLQESLKIGEAIKMIVNILAATQTIERVTHIDLSPRNLLPYTDVRTTHWYRPYAITAYQAWLLENLTDIHPNPQHLKWFTAITPQQFVLLIKRSLEAQNRPHNLALLEPYIYSRHRTLTREWAANLLFYVFPDAFGEWRYIIWQNVQFFQGILQQLRWKTPEQQVNFVRSTIEGLQQQDSEEIGNMFNIDIEVIIELLEKIIS